MIMRAIFYLSVYYRCTAALIVKFPINSIEHNPRNITGNVLFHNEKETQLKISDFAFDGKGLIAHFFVGASGEARNDTGGKVLESKAYDQSGKLRSTEFDVHQELDDGITLTIPSRFNAGNLAWVAIFGDRGKLFGVVYKCVEYVSNDFNRCPKCQLSQPNYSRDPKFCRSSSVKLPCFELDNLTYSSCGDGKWCVFDDATQGPICKKRCGKEKEVLFKGECIALGSSSREKCPDPNTMIVDVDSFGEGFCNCDGNSHTLSYQEDGVPTKCSPRLKPNGLLPIPLPSSYVRQNCGPSAVNKCSFCTTKPASCRCKTFPQRCSKKTFDNKYKPINSINQCQNDGDDECSKNYPYEDIEKVVDESLIPSLFLISLVFITLLFVDQSRKKAPKLFDVTKLCLFISLAIFYLLLCIVRFLSNATNALETTGCIVLGLLTQYSFLAMIFWLNVLCFQVWATFKQFSLRLSTTKWQKDYKFWWFSLYAWGVPAIIVALTAILNNMDQENVYVHPDIGQRSCFFGSLEAVILYNHVVGGTVLLINVGFFCVAFSKIRQAGDNASAKTVIKLFCVMGVSWLAEIISVLILLPYQNCETDSCQASRHQAWGIGKVFDIINALQGVTLFMILFFDGERMQTVRKHISKKPADAKPSASDFGARSSVSASTGVTSSAISNSSKRIMPDFNTVDQEQAESRI